MYVLWIVESPTSSGALVPRLMGQFAVRAVASVNSLLCLLRPGARADLVLVNQAAISRPVPKASDRRLEGLCADRRIPLLRLGQKVPANDGDLVDLVLDHLGRANGARAGGTGAGAGGEVLTYREISFDFEQFRLTLHPGAAPESVSLKEGMLLRLFLKNPDRCLSREEIKHEIWPQTAVSPRTIDSHVARVRRRLNDAGVAIESIYGGGYVLR